MEICISISASTPAEYRDALNALNAGIQAPAAPAPQAAPAHIGLAPTPQTNYHHRHSDPGPI